MDNGSKGDHASNGRIKFIATCLPLECTSCVTSQIIETTGEVLCSQPIPIRGCSAKEEEEEVLVFKKWFAKFCILHLKIYERPRGLMGLLLKFVTLSLIIKYFKGTLKDEIIRRRKICCHRTFKTVTVVYELV